jgi:hypothetical protein
MFKRIKEFFTKKSEPLEKPLVDVGKAILTIYTTNADYPVITKEFIGIASIVFPDDPPLILDAREYVRDDFLKNVANKKGFIIHENVAIPYFSIIKIDIKDEKHFVTPEYS